MYAFYTFVFQQLLNSYFLGDPALPCFPLVMGHASWQLYALRVMIDLAEHYNGTYIPLKEIAERQEISQKYIEGIMTDLSKKHFVDALHGKGGGYKLIRSHKIILLEKSC